MFVRSPGRGESGICYHLPFVFNQLFCTASFTVFDDVVSSVSFLQLHTSGLCSASYLSGPLSFILHSQFHCLQCCCLSVKSAFSDFFQLVFVSRVLPFLLQTLVICLPQLFLWCCSGSLFSINSYWPIHTGPKGIMGFQKYKNKYTRKQVSVIRCSSECFYLSSSKFSSAETRVLVHISLFYGNP